MHISSVFPASLNICTADFKSIFSIDMTPVDHRDSVYHLLAKCFSFHIYHIAHSLTALR